MKDKINTTLVIGELIKKELKKQGKTSVWLSEQLAATVLISIRYMEDHPSILRCCSILVFYSM